MTEFEKMGCTYRQEGDYFLPNLKIGEQDEVLLRRLRSQAVVSCQHHQ